MIARRSVFGLCVWLFAFSLWANFSVKEQGVVISKDLRFIYIDFTEENGIVRDMFFDVYREGFLDSGERSLRYIARIWAVSAQPQLTLTQTSNVEEWEKVQVGDIVVLPAATMDYLEERYLLAVDTLSTFPRAPEPVAVDSLPLMDEELVVHYEERFYASQIIDRIGKKIFITPFDSLQISEILYITNIPNVAIHPQTGEHVVIEREVKLPFMVLNVYRDFLELELIRPEFYRSLSHFSAGRPIQVMRRFQRKKEKAQTPFMEAQLTNKKANHEKEMATVWH